MRLVVFRGKDKDWYVRMVGDNGEPLATTEGHRNHGDAVHAARLLAAGTTSIIDDTEHG